MFRRSRGRRTPGAMLVLCLLAPSVSAAAANPAANVRVTDASARFDLAYAASASALGGYVTSENAPLAVVPRQSADAYTITSASARALAGELIYRAVADPTRECTFRYTLTYAGTKFILTTDAHASWTGAVTCVATTSTFDKNTGTFSVTFTMQ